jgi:hypothetical protein
VLLVAASVSYTRGYSFDIVDSDGRPQPGDALYTNRFHNAWARIVPRSAASEMGIWQMTTRNRDIVFDLTDRPERWDGSMSNLSFFMSPAVRDVDHSRAGPLLELTDTFARSTTPFSRATTTRRGQCRRCRRS